MVVLVANPGIVTRTCPRGCVRNSSRRAFSTCLRLLTVRSRASARLGMIWAQASVAGSSMGWDFTASQIRGAALSDRRGERLWIRLRKAGPARSPQLPDGRIFTKNVQDSGTGQPVADNPFQSGAGAEQRFPETVDDPRLIGGEVFVVSVQRPHTSQLLIGCLHDVEPVQVAAGVIRQNPGVFRIRFSRAVV